MFLWLSPSIWKIERENHKSGGGRIQNRNALSPQFLSAVFDTTSSAMGSNQDSVWLTLTGISPPPSCGPPSLRCLGLGGRIIMALHRSSQCVLPRRTADSFPAPILLQPAGTFQKVILYSPLRRSSWRTAGSAFRFRLYRVKYPDCWI